MYTLIHTHAYSNTHTYAHTHAHTTHAHATHAHSLTHLYTCTLSYTHMHIHKHASPVLSCLSTDKSGPMTLLRLEGASKAESSSFAGVSDSGSLLFLHLCTAIVLLCYRTISGTCYTAKHLSVLLLALLSQPSTYASSCHSSYGKFYHTLYLHRCSSHPGSLSHW